MPRDAATFQVARAHPTRFLTPDIVAGVLRQLADVFDDEQFKDRTVDEVNVEIDTSRPVSTIGRVTVTWEDA